MKHLLRFADIIETIFVHVVGIVFIALITCTFVEVIFRYFLQNPLAWSEELARFLMVWMGFMGAAVCTKREQHLQLGISIARWINPRADRWVMVALNLAFMVFMVFLVKAGIDVCANTMEFRSPAMRLPMVYVLGVIPVTGATMLLFNGVSLYRMIIIKGG
ncbi:MAG: TRAP transporter small permease [Deltaproteobacteria bacterium]|nr:TRAP transporter small permease [Deltaproteobacteria bacterium]